MDSTNAEQAESTHTRLAREIARRRVAAGLSQPQLARRIAYTRQYVSLAERNHNLPSRSLITAIDRELNANGALINLLIRP